MKIHTNTITAPDMRRAAQAAGVDFARFTTRFAASRSHRDGWDVILSGSGPRRSQYRAQDVPAATWDEWGIFLRVLFQIDPTTMCGNRSNPIYANAEHFGWATTGRFDDLAPEGQHRVHRWNYTGTSMGGAYTVRECKCGAHQRWLVHLTWRDFAGV